MRQYGANKATEFTRKQIGVIYSNAKNHTLNIEKWIMNDLYEMADYYGYDDNKSVERCERNILNILNAVFSNNMEEAQTLINNYTEEQFNLLGRKNQQTVNRQFV